MKRLLLIVMLFLTLGGQAWGATYTIGSTDDYASFAAYRVAHASDTAGDTISFRKGETFNETITLNASGTSENVIIVTSHGSGAKPIIDPSIPVTNWTGPDVNGVYTATTNGYSAMFAYEDGIPLLFGTNPPTVAGTWYKSESTFYYIPSTGVATDHVVRMTYYVSGGEAGVLPRGISMSNLSYITINGLRIDRGIGVAAENGTNITLQNCDFYYSPVRAVMFWGSGTIGPFTVSGNYVYRSFAGIYAGRDPSNGEVVSTGFAVSSNTIVDCGTANGTTTWTSYGIGSSAMDLESISGQNVQDSTWSGNSITGGICPGPMMYSFPTGTTSGNLIRGNFIYNTTGSGIKMQGDGAGTINNNSIAYNILSQVGANNETNQAVFEVIAPTGSTQMNYFYNNSIYIPSPRTAMYNFYLYAATVGNYRNWTIKNNAILGPGMAVWIRNGTGQGHADDSTVIINSNWYSITTGNRWFVGSSEDIIQYNFTDWKATRGSDVSPASNGADPLFINSGGSYALATDFRLYPLSLCINAGENVGLTFDYFGNAVPFGVGVDIGAYEYKLVGIAGGTIVGGSIR